MRKQAEDKLFRVYLTDGLKAIADNTVALHSKGVSLKHRYIDLIDIKRTDDPEKDPNETADQIKTRIMAGLNKLVKNNDTGNGEE